MVERSSLTNYRMNNITAVDAASTLSGRVCILATRCANYQDVFVAGNVYFVDADCYARMTRAQMVREKPGLIIRHHAFENFPQGRRRTRLRRWTISSSHCRFS
jgi:hypothetical protein